MSWIDYSDIADVIMAETLIEINKLNQDTTDIDLIYKKE